MGQIALLALGMTLMIAEPSASTARLAIRQRSGSYQQIVVVHGALPPPD
jgi:hypothetical protein